MAHLDYVICVGILLILVLIVLAWIDLRRRIMEVNMRVSKWPSHHIHWPYLSSDDLYSIYVFQAGTWRLERACPAPDLEDGPPPSREGWYEGETVKIKGIKK
jgi:hypothetical protein